MGLTPAVKYAPCSERVGDYLGYCVQDENLKVRAATEEEAWVLITELIEDFQEADIEAQRIIDDFNNKWSVKNGKKDKQKRRLKKAG